MKLKVKRIHFIFLVLLLSTFLLYLNICSGSDQASPLAKKGILDISHWSLENKGNVALDGQWEFYWNKLLNYNDFHSKKAPKCDGYFNIPSVWNNYKLHSSNLPGFGYATYRLKIKTKNLSSLYGLHIITMSTSYALMINNNLVASNGVVASNPVKARPQYKTQTVAFANHSNYFEIIIQVSNYSYSRGGIWHSISLGTDQHIRMLKEYTTFKEVFCFAILAILGIYYIIMYLIQSDGQSSLYYSLTIIIASLRIPVTGDHFITDMLPNFPMQTMVRIEYMTMYWGPIMWALFVYELFPKDISKKFIKVVIYISAFLTAFTLLLPVSVFTAYLVIYEAVFIVVFVYVLFRIAICMKKRYDSADLLFLVAFIALITFFNDVLYYWNMIPNKFDGTFGYAVILGMLVQAYVLAERYSKAFKEVEILSNKLISLDKLKDEFLATTSHELRTPLNVILNISQSLIKNLNTKLTPAQNQDLQVIISSSRRLYNLINNLLDISCLKNKEIKLYKKPLDVKIVADSAISVLEYLKGNKEIVFQNNIPTGLPAVFCDEERLGQIFYNLLGNALKFTEKGYIKVNASIIDNMMNISVEDTGIGIPEDKLESIFNSFEQVDSSINRKHEGTGLGLYITRQLVELHGGKIEVKSMTNKGSFFSFTVPMTDKRPENNLELETKGYKIGELDFNAQLNTINYGDDFSYNDSLDLNKYNILAVDDDPASLKALINTLTIEGYSVKGVTSGYGALKMLQNGAKFDLVILDVMMPEISGFATLSIIRKKYSPIELPVLLLTSLNRTEDISMGFKLKTNDYLAKPFEAEELIARVNNLVQLKRTVNELVQMELSFLQAQIKPHFIYNALSVIASLCVINPEKAKNLILDLSDYLRGNFDFVNKDGLTTLKKELETVKAYLSIEQERFDERISVELDIDENIDCTIPVLSIQPIVENAVRHGIMQKLEGGKITIRITSKSNYIKITVRDNGVGIEAKKLSEILSLKSPDKMPLTAEKYEGRRSSVGLKNIHRRLLSLYGRGLTITGCPDVGTTVEFIIPLNPDNKLS